MAYPTKYTRQYDYVSYQNANPARPLPAGQIHADYNAMAASLANTIDFLKISLRADGAITNGAVGWDQLALSVQAITGDPTAVEEIIAEASTSADAAALSATGAATSATNAASSASAAETSATNAASSAAAAATSAASIATTQYETLAVAIAATIPDTINAVHTLGRGTVGVGGAIWTRLGGAPGVIRSWHFQNTHDGSWWAMAAPVGWNVSPAQFATGLTNTAIQDALDFLQTFGVTGGRVTLEPNQIYTGTFSPKVWNGLTLDCNGSKITTTLSGSGAYGVRVGDNAEICNGWVHAIDGGITDSQFIFGPAISLGVANASPGNLIATPDYFASCRPRVRNMKVSCTRQYCPVIQIMGDVTFLIENIEIPSNSTSSGIHADWSDIGGTTVAAGTGPGGSYINDLERVSKWNTAYNNGNGTVYTTHPKGIIRNVKAGNLTVAATGDSGSRAVRLSACRDILIENVFIAECTLPAFDHVGGDFGFEFARRNDQRNGLKGIRVRNLVADLCHYYGVFVDTFADNIQNAVALGYSNGVDTYMYGDVIIESVSVVGPFNDVDDGIRIQNAKGVKVIDANVVGFYNGVRIEDNTEQVVIERGRVWRNQAAGVSVKSASTIKSILFDGVDSQLNGTGAANSAGIDVQGGSDILVHKCYLGGASEDGQKYGITVGSSALRVSLIENQIRAVTSGGAALNLPAATMDPLWVVRGNVYAGAQSYITGGTIIPIERTPKPSGGFHTRAVAKASSMTSGVTPTYGTFVQGDLIEIPDAASAASAIARKGASTWGSIATVP